MSYRGSLEQDWGTGAQHSLSDHVSRAEPVERRRRKAIQTPEGGNEISVFCLGVFLVNRSQFATKLLFLEEPTLVICPFV
jgi:hypothetical protein